MAFETDRDFRRLDETSIAAPSLPPDVLLTDRAVTVLRGFLVSAGLDKYRIFYGGDLDLDDIERYIEALEEDGVWESAGLGGASAEPLAILVTHEKLELREGG